MSAPTEDAQSTAATTTQIIVLICFLRFQSALPKEFFGIICPLHIFHDLRAHGSFR